MAATDKELARIHKIIAEKKERGQHPLKLFRPLKGGQEDFLRSKARKRILRGGNRAGKTMTCSMEFASAALGIPLKDSEGNEIPFTYPTDRPLTMWIIAIDLFHVARNIHRLLFKPGAFKVIRDLETGEIRAYNPFDPKDVARKKEAKWAPPLIPEKFVQEWSWENKAQRVFNVCRLVNGTEIYAFSSRGEAPQGDQCDLIWVDEDLANDEFIKESAMRILDRGGRFMWSAFPHQGNEALLRLSEEAEAEVKSPQPEGKNPICQEYVIKMSENPHLDREAVTDILAGLSDEERQARDDGDFCLDYVSMFPMFHEFTHGIKVHEGEQDSIDAEIVKNNLEPPFDWTRYLVLDPGTARPAVLFAAIPPPQFDRNRDPTIVIYDEIAIPRLNAIELAEKVYQKTRDQAFEAFIIDGHAGRQTSLGRGETTQQLYSIEFEKRGIRSRATGSGFIQGSDNVTAGIDFIRRYLHINSDGKSRIRVIRDKVPNLCRQLKKYKKSMTKDVVSDKPASNQIDDLVDCLRYLAAFNPQYRRPEKKYSQLGTAYRAFLDWTGKKKTNETVTCGPQYS